VSALKLARIVLALSLLTYALALIAGRGSESGLAVAILSTFGIAFGALACVGMQLFLFARRRLVTNG